MTTVSNKSIPLALILLLAAIIACNEAEQKNNAGANSRVQTIAGGVGQDSVLLKESSNEDDLSVNEFLTNSLKPIRTNFKRINSIIKWDSVIKRDLEKTTEGGEASFYYSKGQLEKIIVQQYGETFQQLNEFYLLNGLLSFVLEKSLKYNRPIYYDSAAMKEYNDTEIFDIKKSEMIEDRSYFENNRIIHQLNNRDSVTAFSNDYLKKEKEQQRIKADFDQLMLIRRQHD